MKGGGARGHDLGPAYVHASFICGGRRGEASGKTFEKTK